LTANFPLGNPAVRSPQPMVVTPPFRWPRMPAELVTGVRGTLIICSTPRPFTGTTTYATATTARPGTGTTAFTTTITTRPDTGITEEPC
jgi:hypothetical protein